MNQGQTLVVEGISMSFDGKYALRDVDLTIHGGQIHGLIGHNGSGKSTLVRILAGYHHQTSGTVRLGSEVLPAGAPAGRHARGLRFVHQELGLVDQFSGLENFGLGGGYDRTPWRTIDWRAQERRLREVMEMLKCELPVHEPVSNMTAVQRALLAIARAIAAGSASEGARLLVLDEPTTTLEGPETEQLFRVVRTLAATGIGVLYISHHLSDVIDLCSEVTVLRDGRVVEALSTQGATRARLVSALVGTTAETVPEEGVAEAIAATAIDGDGAVAPKGGIAYAVRGLRSELLDGIDLEIRRGECVCVVGLTGSGREQLAYAAAGVVTSEADSIEFQGRQVEALDPKRCRELGIALVPGNRLPGSMVREFNMRENLTFASLKESVKAAGSVDRKRETVAARRWIERFDIKPDDPEFSSRHMSGGNKQKVILAKWLSIEPSFMIIDEPTAGVDVGAAKALLATLRAIADGGGALLVSTSEIDDALAIADRIVVLYEGQVSGELKKTEDELSEESVMLAMSGRSDGGDELAQPAVAGENRYERKGGQ
ncbi:MAG: sugar ABC transporter ATP-binding protein [Solirubrobacteraceae bacterium]